MDIAAFEAYLGQLDRLGKVLEELTGLAQKKAVAVNRGDLKGVEDIMRREQALSMSLRGLELHREEKLKGLGLSGTALSDLPGHAPEELRLKTKKAVEELRRRYDLYRDAAEVARTTLECNLHMIEKHRGDAAPSGGSLTDIRA